MPLIPTTALANISPTDQQALQNALADAVGIVTNQGREDLAKFIQTYSPSLILLAPKAAAGDTVAQTDLNHVRAQMVSDAGIYGVNVLQKQEQALLVAIDVFIKVIVGLILPAATA